MQTLKNSKLEISVKKTGAELCKIESIKHKTQFMWDANPTIWGSFAPNLFPIIGSLKNNTYTFKGNSYHLPKHGFIRNSSNLTLDNQTKNSLTYKVKTNESTLKIYPFHFEFYITYTLIDNKIEVHHLIKNTGNEPMFFSLGGHPAFKCPVFDKEDYNDYFLEFEHKENSNTNIINTDNGLISSQTKTIFHNSNILNLSHDLFKADALIFKDLKSKKVRLKSKNKGEVLFFEYQDFPYLGIWAKPEGDFVCIEPWLGIADAEDTDQEFITKEGILKLEPKKTFKACYSIEIHNNHLE